MCECMLFLPHSSLVLLFTPLTNSNQTWQSHKTTDFLQVSWKQATEQSWKTSEISYPPSLPQQFSCPCGQQPHHHPSQTCRKADICVQLLPQLLVFQSGFMWESGITDVRLCYGCRCSHKSSSGTQLLRRVWWYHPAFLRHYTSSLKRLLNERCSIFHTSNTSVKLLMLLLKIARQIPTSACKWDQPEEIPLDGWPDLWFESNHTAAKCWHQLWCIV